MSRPRIVLLRGGLLAAFCAIATISSAADLFGVQNQNPDILFIDTVTGVATVAFPVPTGRNATGFDGLTLAEGGSSLLYVEGTPEATSPLYRLNPTTGATLSTHSLVSHSGFRAGLSFDTANGMSIFVVDDGGGVGRQAGFGGAYTRPFVANAPQIPGALGGDDFGRHFVTNVTGVIQEFSPVNGAILNSYPSPAPNMAGLAFDGTHLYCVDSVNRLYTMDPNTGAVLSSVLVSGGTGFEISGLAARPIPEPSSLLLFGVVGIFVGAQSRRRMRPRSSLESHGVPPGMSFHPCPLHRVPSG